MVPCTPVVVTEPLIVLSAATLIVPLPLAAVFTGGTSLSPLSLSIMSSAMARPANAAAATAIRANRVFMRDLLGMVRGGGNCVPVYAREVKQIP